ncbi:MAG: hypothetical protein PVJ92_02375 [Candidatus Dependentiae bacterium]|jgi:hypothetical protein
MFFNKRLLIPLLTLLCTTNCFASSYHDQLVKLQRTPTSTLYISQQLPDEETRNLLYHSISNGGLLVDVYKACSKKYKGHTLYYLAPKEMPRLYKAVEKAIPAALRANTQFYFFLSDTPIDTFGWSYRYAPLDKGNKPANTIALPLARDAFMQLDDAGLEKMVIAKTAQCLLYHHQSVAAKSGRAERDQKTACAGIGVGITTLLATLYFFHKKGWLMPLLEATTQNPQNVNPLTLIMLIPATALGSYASLYTHRWQTKKLKKLLSKLFTENFSTLQQQIALDELLTGYRTELLSRSLQNKQERENTVKYLQKAGKYHTTQRNRLPLKLHEAYEKIATAEEEDERLTRKYQSLSGEGLTRNLEEELTQVELDNLDREHHSQTKEAHSWFTRMLRWC